MLSASPADTRPTYPTHSRALVNADKRTRQLAAAMLRLNADGGCTDVLLASEGFSAHEQAELGDAARLIANQGFVRHIEESGVPPRPTDDELIGEALERARAAFTPTEIRRVIGKGLSHDRLAAIWPRACIKLASEIARLPIPGAAS